MALFDQVKEEPAVSGRPRRPLSATGPRAELAKRLRALRDERDVTLRELAARSGYSLSSLSTAESGRRVPSWDVIASFVQACGHDPEQWRQLWEVARDSTDPETEPETDSVDQPETVAVPRRIRLRGRVLLIAGVALLAVVVAAVLFTWPSGSAGPAAGPASASVALPAAAHVPPVRRAATVDLSEGQYLDLDPVSAWNRGVAPDSAKHDLSFSAAQRTLLSMNVASTVVLTGANQGYPDCLSGPEGQTLAPAAVKPGVGLCVTTRGGRWALATITAAHTDTTGRPDRLTLRITVWEIQPDPFDPAPPAHPAYAADDCVNVDGPHPDGVTIRPSGDPRLSGWQSSRAVMWGAPQCPNQIWWTPYVNDGLNPLAVFSWVFRVPVDGRTSCTLWAYYPPPPSGHSGGTAHYSVNDGPDSSALQLGYLAVSQADFRGSWHGLGQYPVHSGTLSLTLDNSGSYLGLEQGAIAGPVHIACHN